MATEHVSGGVATGSDSLWRTTDDEVVAYLQSLPSIHDAPYGVEAATLEGLDLYRCSPEAANNVAVLAGHRPLSVVTEKKSLGGVNEISGLVHMRNSVGVKFVRPENVEARLAQGWVLDNHGVVPMPGVRESL